jgi:hypothetical protein
MENKIKSDENIVLRNLMEETGRRKEEPFHIIETSHSILLGVTGKEVKRDDGRAFSEDEEVAERGVGSQLSDNREPDC